MEVTEAIARAGDTYINEGDDYWTSGISVGEHGNRIVCYGASESEAAALRDNVLTAMRALEPRASSDGDVVDASNRLQAWLDAEDATHFGQHEKDIETILAALQSQPSSNEARLREALAWQDISTAPYAMTVLATRFDQDVGEWVTQVVLSPPSQPFTHWRLLPEHPALSNEGNG